MARFKIIYEPKREAREYSPLAVNLQIGCEHACRYCYAPQVLRKNRKKFHAGIRAKRNALERLRHDAIMLCGDDRQILLSFGTDPYSPNEMVTGLTRQAIEILIDNKLRFAVLTKGGTRACKDFDLFEKYPKCIFATSLIFTSQEDADYWEPNAASVADRIKAIKIAHKKGIETWVNLEPVIDPVQVIALVKKLYPIVDLWTVGMLNYNKKVSGKVDWSCFHSDITSLFASLEAKYYIKKTLKVAAGVVPHDESVVALPHQRSISLAGPLSTEAERVWFATLKQQIEKS